MVIKEADTAALERELARSNRILSSNKNLMPQSNAFYRQRCKLIEAELKTRAARS